MNCNYAIYLAITFNCSLIEYSYPLYFWICLTLLDMIYHNTIKSATNLTCWTPIPVLHSEAVTSFISVIYFLIC